MNQVDIDKGFPIMKITVNDKDIEIFEGSNITSLLAQLGIPSGRVVVERNNAEIISRSKFEEVILNEGDRLEVLNFVGGGLESNLRRI